jgi:hypothetical protein
MKACFVKKIIYLVILIGLVGCGATDSSKKGESADNATTADTTAPIISGLTDTAIPAGSKTWTWSCSESCTYRYIIDKFPTTSPSGGYGGSTSVTKNTGAGIYYIHIQAQDNFNNLSAVYHAYAVLNAVPADGEDVFSASSLAGNGISSTSITGQKFDPDLAWIKMQSTVSDHILVDSTRGVSNYVKSNTGDAEVTDVETVQSFDLNGVTLGDSADVNAAGETFSTWLFRENTAFMDIVAYTGNATQTTAIAHNLGVAPAFMLIKNISTGASDWVMYHSDMNNGETEPLGAPDNPGRWVMNLNTSLARAYVEGSHFANVAPSTTDFTLGSHAGVNAAGDNYVAYLFSGDTSNTILTGIYTGNGSTTGPIITTNFQPMWVLIKRKDSAGDWVILDNAMDTSSPHATGLVPNSTGSSNTYTGGIAFNSANFQLTSVDVNINDTAGEYIYMAIGK